MKRNGKEKEEGYEDGVLDERFVVREEHHRAVRVLGLQ